MNLLPVGIIVSNTSIAIDLKLLELFVSLFELISLRPPFVRVWGLIRIYVPMSVQYASRPLWNPLVLVLLLRSLRP